MWKHIFVPTLFVSVLWVVFSGLTTWYIHWQDQIQSRLLAENVSSIHATGLMQSYVWQMEAVAFDTHTSPDTRQARLKNLETSFRTALTNARNTALTLEEPPLIDEISQRFERFRTRLHRTIAPGNATDGDILKDALDSAETVVDPCQKLLALNDDVLTQAAHSRKSLSTVVFVTRTSVLIIGPALGILLGLRISRRLHRSISEISITLKDAAGDLDREIGRVNLSANLDLPDLRRQVQAVALRFRQIVDELHQARQEVLRQEHLAAVGELAAGVAHELRNPMTSVKLLLQATAQRNRAIAGDRQFQIILDEFSRMENTIQGLLDFARPPELRRIHHDVRQTVQRALNLIDGRARQQAVIIETNFCDAGLIIDGDPEQLHQVFINLLLNATESMSSGGVLSVATESVAGGTKARVRVSDTGCGIPPTIQPRLFEPFATSKERGVGLGLAISRRIIHDHHGRLWGENQPSGGAVFSIELPLQVPVVAVTVNADPRSSDELIAATL